MALLSMALIHAGRDAISFTGQQAGIITDDAHGRAKIVEVQADRVRRALDSGKIAIVAGFQGVSTTDDVTTLGRGGSDMTAVALAAALGAEVCEIYTDVDGVFSADPRIVDKARKLPVVSFEEMLEMSASGAKVLQLRSVEYARNYGVRIHVRPSFGPGSGTLVVSEEETMERPLVTAVTHSTDDARITLTGVPDQPGVAGRIFTALAGADVNLDMIVQNEPVSADQRAEISFTVPKDDIRSAHAALDRLKPELGLADLIADERIGKVSVVGAGMRSHPGVAAKVFTTLGDLGINIEMISTSPIKISCAIDAARVPDAVRALHQAFGLGAEDVHPEDPYGPGHRPGLADGDEPR
jgi:aspartate kinase